MYIDYANPSFHLNFLWYPPRFCCISCATLHPNQKVLTLYVSDDERLWIDLILPDLKAAQTTQVYQTLCNRIDSMIGFPARTLFSQLMAREEQASSGIGEGVAIPHLRLPT